MEKYQRFLKSAAARQQGLYFQLENYYRTGDPAREAVRAGGIRSVRDGR
jgi:hypothetical protein